MAGATLERVSADIEGPLFAGSPHPILIVDPRARAVVAANAAALRQYGYTQAEFSGLPLAALWPRGEAILRRAARLDTGLRTWRHRRKNGEWMQVSVAVQQLAGEGGRSIALHVNDVTERAFSVALLESHSRVLEMVARGSPLERILAELVRTMERLSSGMLGSVLLLDEEGRRLRHGAAPSLPAPYWRAIDGVPIGPEVGSCGTAAHLGRQVIVADIALDPLWKDYRALALAHGLRACWSTPIFSRSRRVLGAFALYYREPRAPGERELRLVRAAADLAAIAIERDRAYRALHDSESRLRALTARLHGALEAERARIARDVHDVTGQALSALRMNLTLLVRGLREAREPLDAPGTAAKLESMQSLIDETLASVSRVATQLRPQVLDTLGLEAALEWQAAEFSRHTGIACEVSLPQGRIVTDPERAIALFRIFQEALTNVARHAGARRVRAELRPAGPQVELVVADDGCGISEAQIAAPASLGLLGMRERAAIVNGETLVAGVPGRGTTVTVRVPAA